MDKNLHVILKTTNHILIPNGATYHQLHIKCSSKAYKFIEILEIIHKINSQSMYSSCRRVYVSNSIINDVINDV